MLKKVVGFICEIDEPFDSNIESGSYGGAETWIFKIAEQFAQHGYHVIIFNKINYNHICNDIEFVQWDFIESRLSHQYFTHIFINRIYNQDIINLIRQCDCCENIYFIAHDMRLWHTKSIFKYIDVKDTFMGLSDIWQDDWHKQHIHNLFVMSDWHKACNLEYFNNDFLQVIGNGVDIKPIENNIRDNSILWSSCYNRGLNILVERIAPIILQFIPDFKIYTCSYSQELPDNYQNCPYIINLGQLNKQDLYNEMRKHKVTYLPLTHWETFCITVIENILNDVEVVCPFKFGVQTTLKYFNNILIQDGDYNNVEYCNYVAQEIINKMANYDNNSTIRTILKTYIADNYSWSSIYNKLYLYISKYETNNCNY